jgi:hypothetical protein
VPPDPGRRLLSSAQTNPSASATTAPTTQHSSACGPPITPTINGRVMNGPMPIMLFTLSAVACGRPIPRTSSGGGSLGGSGAEDGGCGPRAPSIDAC